MCTQDARSSFAQLTVRVRAAHKFAAYDGKRRLVAGDLEKEVPVQDVWVLERSFKEEPTSRWRVAGAAFAVAAPLLQFVVCMSTHNMSLIRPHHMTGPLGILSGQPLFRTSMQVYALYAI